MHNWHGAYEDLKRISHGKLIELVIILYNNRSLFVLCLSSNGFPKYGDSKTLETILSDLTVHSLSV